MVNLIHPFEQDSRNPIVGTELVADGIVTGKRARDAWSHGPVAQLTEHRSREPGVAVRMFHPIGWVAGPTAPSLPVDGLPLTLRIGRRSPL